MKTKSSKISFFVSALLFLAMIGSLAMPLQTARAGALISVCASGCDQPTIQAALAVAVSGDTINVTSGMHTVTTTEINTAKLPIQVTGGELQISGMELAFGDQNPNDVDILAVQTYVSFVTPGVVTLLANVESGAKWLYVSNGLAGKFNNILGSGGNVRVRFPGTSTAFSSVSMDLGPGDNILEFNGANLDLAGTTIQNVDRMYTTPSSVGDFVKPPIHSFDLSKLGSDLDTVLINPMSTFDGEVTYTNAPVTMTKMVIVPAAFSFGTALKLASLSYAASSAPLVTVELRKDGYNSKNLDRLGTLEVNAEKFILDANNLNTSSSTTIDLLKGTCINEILITGTGKPIVTSLTNGAGCLQKITLQSTFTGQLVLGSAFDSIPVINGRLVSGAWIYSESPCTTDCYVAKTGNDSASGSSTAPFLTIQKGIDSVSPDGTVNVAAGIYTEQVTITKSLDLIGAGEGSTTIQAPTTRTGPPVTQVLSDRTIVHDYLLAAYATSGTIDVRVEGFTLNVNGQNKTPGTGQMDGVFFRDVKDTGGMLAGLSSSTIHNFAPTPDYEGFGVVVYGDSLLTLNDNDIHDYTRDGIGINRLDGAGSDPDVTISGNTVTGTAKSLNGISVDTVSAGAVTGNTVTGNFGALPWASGGIVLWSSTGVPITGNHVDGNFYGIDLYTGSHDITISGNELTGNVKRGISLGGSSATNNNIVKSNTITGPVTGTDDVAIGLSNGSTGNMIGGPNPADANIITMATSGTGNLYAIHMESGAGSNTIRYNTISGGQRAVQFDGPPGITGTTTIANNTISGQEFGGITAYNNGDLVVTDNTLTNAVRPIEFFGPVNVTVTGNTINGSTYAGITLGAFSGTATVSGNTIHNIATDQNGIWAQTSGAGLSITGNTIYDISGTGGGGGRGIQIDPSADGANIDGNEIYNITGFSGIVIDTGATGVKINNNYVYNNELGVVANEQTAEFHGNRILKNRWGIDLNSAGATFTLLHNQIAGNNTNPADSYGLGVWAGTAMAEENWWGEDSGPAGVGLGTGDKVSANVDYDPWCNNAACVTASIGPSGEIIIPPSTSATDIQAVISAASDGDVIVLPAEVIAVPGGFFIDHPGVTIELSPGTVLIPSSPCFTVSADDTTITGGGTCTPTGGSSGIVISALTPISNIEISGIIIDGTGNTADGIVVNSNVTNLTIINNSIHDMGVDGIHFANGVTIFDPQDIHGNKLDNNTGADVNNQTTTTHIIAENNWWGAASGPAAGKVLGDVDYTPWCVNETCSGNVPNQPSSFYGNLHFNDGDPSVGTTIQAFVTGVTAPVASTTVTLYPLVTGVKVYQIDVPENTALSGNPKNGGEGGDTVTFMIGTRIVATGTWSSGSNTPLDFHPPAAIPAATSGNEGSSITFSGSATDSGGDVATYALDWNNDSTYETTGPTVSHIWTDNGTPTVGLKVTDAQGGEGTTTFVVTVSNVAPTATFNHPAVDEGSDILLSLTAPFDPSSADTLAGFEYNFACDGVSYGSWSSTSTAACSTSDKGTRSVGAMIRDKDLAVTTYTATVTIHDVLPTSVNAGGSYNGIAGQAVNITGSATCATVDTCIYAWDLDGDAAYDDASGTSISYPWNNIGVYAIGLQVTDSDGNPVTAHTTVTIAGATHSLTLVPGWHLVSFNLIPANTATATVLNSIAGNYDLVYGWDATGAHSASSGNWLKFAPGGPSYANTLNNMDETMGFWIHMTSSDILDVVGSVPTAPATDITLSDTAGGWNLVAYPSAVNRGLPDALRDHGVGIDFTLVYAYHASDTADPWKLYDRTAPGYASDLKELAPGLGYWVKVNTGPDKTWNVAYLAP